MADDCNRLQEPGTHPQYTRHDWPEDDRGDGLYQNKCLLCGTLFVGDKRRHICKVCADTPEGTE